MIKIFYFIFICFFLPLSLCLHCKKFYNKRIWSSSWEKMLLNRKVPSVHSCIYYFCKILHNLRTFKRCWMKIYVIIRWLKWFEGLWGLLWNMLHVACQFFKITKKHLNLHLSVDYFFLQIPFHLLNKKE